MSKIKNRKLAKTLRGGGLVMADDFGFRFYVIRRTKTGRWELPGGRIDTGESVAAGAAREVAEEIGTEVEVLGKAVSVVFSRGDKDVSYSAYVMAAAQEPVLAESGFDAIEAVSWLELELMPLSDSLAAVRDAVHC